MARLIDANDLLEKTQWFEDYCYECGSEWAFKYIDPEDVENAPTIDAVEVVHGRWIGKPIAGFSDVRCSVCRVIFTRNRGTWDYCPYCGTKMDLEEI